MGLISVWVCLLLVASSSFAAVMRSSVLHHHLTCLLQQGVRSVALHSDATRQPVCCVHCDCVRALGACYCTCKCCKMLLVV